MIHLVQLIHYLNLINNITAIYTDYDNPLRRQEVAEKEGGQAEEKKEEDEEEVEEEEGEEEKEEEEEDGKDEKEEEEVDCKNADSYI